MPVDVLADISDAASKVPIEIDEEYVQALCEKSTDRALAGSAGADQSNHRIAIGSGIRSGELGLDVQDVLGKGSDTRKCFGTHPSRLIRPLFVVTADVRTLNRAPRLRSSG